VTTVHSMVVRSTADQTHLEYPSHRPSWFALQCFRTFLWRRFAYDFVSHSSRLQSMNDDGGHRRWSPLYHQIFLIFSLFSGLYWRFLAQYYQNIFLLWFFSLLAGYFYITTLFVPYFTVASCVIIILDTLTGESDNKLLYSRCVWSAVLRTTILCTVVTSFLEQV